MVHSEGQIEFKTLIAHLQGKYNTKNCIFHSKARYKWHHSIDNLKLAKLDLFAELTCKIGFSRFAPFDEMSIYNLLNCNGRIYDMFYSGIFMHLCINASTKLLCCFFQYTKIINVFCKYIIESLTLMSYFVFLCVSTKKKLAPSAPYVAW